MMEATLWRQKDGSSILHEGRDQRSVGPDGSWSSWTPDVKWFVLVLCRDISYTALSTLPDHILSGLKKLIAESAFQLKELPPPELFGHLQQANLTFPSHCCAFHNLRRNRCLFLPPPNLVSNSEP